MGHNIGASQKGYPWQWFTEDCQRGIDQKGLNCSLCKLVLRDAVQTRSCGSRFCKACYEGLFKDVPPGPITCPQCEHEDVEDSRHLAPNEYQPDNFCRNQVKHLTARCECYELGCDWTGTVIDYEQHFRTHDGALCCVCGQEFPNVLKHRRHMVTSCPKAVKAPMLQPPCSACKHDEVLGPDHIVFMCSETQSLRAAIERLSAHSTTRHHVKGKSLPLSTSPVKPREAPESPAAAKPGQYETLMDKNKANTTLITVLYNEVKTCSHKLISMDNESVNSDVADLKQRLTLLERIATDAQNKLGAIERRLLDGGVCNTSGRLTWRIDNVRQRMEEARSGTTPALYSSTFFTSDAGYKACARLYLNGDGIGKDSHVSLFFVLMKGRFDAILPWPFTHRVTMLLLDQSGQGQHVQEKFRPDPNSSSFQRPRSEMNIATGCPRFISKSELERHKTLYMKENTMFIQMIVE